MSLGRLETGLVGGILDPDTAGRLQMENKPQFVEPAAAEAVGCAAGVAAAERKSAAPAAAAAETGSGGAGTGVLALVGAVEAQVQQA